MFMDEVKTTFFCILVLIFKFLCIFQYMSEKIGGAEKTKLDEEFMEMERVSFNIHNIEHTQVLSVFGSLLLLGSQLYCFQMNAEAWFIAPKLITKHKIASAQHHCYCPSVCHWFLFCEVHSLNEIFRWGWFVFKYYMLIRTLKEFAQERENFNLGILPISSVLSKHIDIMAIWETKVRLGWLSRPDAVTVWANLAKFKCM